MPSTRADDTEAKAPWLSAALGAVALVLAVRAVSLALGLGSDPTVPATPPAELDKTHRVAVAADAAMPNASVEEPAKTNSVPGGQGRLTEQQFAAIAGLCPTSLSDLPPELLPLSSQRPPPSPDRRESRVEAGSASGRLTGVRLASRGPMMPLLADPKVTEPRVAQVAEEPADGWLVAPDAWFAPEDQPTAGALPTAEEPSIGAETPIETASDETASTEPVLDGLEEERSFAENEIPPREVPLSDPREFDPVPLNDEVTPWPVDEAPLPADRQAAGLAEPTDANPFPNTQEEPVAEAEEDPALPPSESGPSFLPPGVATPSPEPTTLPQQLAPPPAPSTPLAQPSEGDGLSAPEEAAPEEAAADSVDEELESPRWEGAYDSVVPATPTIDRPEPSMGGFEPQTEPTAPNSTWSTDSGSLSAPVVEQETAPPAEPVFTPPPRRPAAPLTPKPSTQPTPRPAVQSAPYGIAMPALAQPHAVPTETLPFTPRREPPATSPKSIAPAAPAPQPPVRNFTPPKPKAEPNVAPAVAPKRPLFDKPATHPGGGAQAAVEARKAAGEKTADESHRELFSKNNYPSALECAACHERIYKEWSVSSHAYAFVSPMYHKFEQTITDLSNGTVGHFCQRCHSPVATAMNEPRSVSLNDVSTVAREGVTCIVCHRVNQRWGKSNGERRIEPGDIYAPVYGGVGGDGVAKAIADKKAYKVKTSPNEKGPGQAIHNEGRFFDQLTQAEACTSCHQVAVHPGIKLEVVWEQYRASPACEKGITCQECHMGKIPGMAGGYNYGPIAELNGKTVNSNRKQSSHIFYGPGYSIAHPGVFPQNKDAMKWEFNDWLAFDWRSGWGTDDFEERIDDMEDSGVDTSLSFPKVWADPDDRADAREIVEDNLERLQDKRRYRELVMENGSKVAGPFFRQSPAAGTDLKFEYVVANMNEGHNLPTASLGAQPQLWANVVLIGPDGRRLWETGYTDSNGDLCDIHSVDVRHGRIPFDKQLFNLQTMFLITGATGTDREFYLPVNLDFDQVAHLRPGNVPYTTQNHPPFIRMESRSLAPLGKKRVKYTVPAELMRQRGRYRLSFRMRNRTEPMYFMRLCKATPEMHRSMIEGTLDIHPQSVEFDVP